MIFLIHIFDINPPQVCETGISVDKAWDFIKENGGVDTEDSYPYEEEDDTCRFNPSNVGATVKKWTRVGDGSDEEAMRAAIISYVS